MNNQLSDSYDLDKLDNLDNAKKQKKQKQSIKTRTMEDQLIKENEMKNILNNFVAELHCASDKRKKNKSNWKFTKRVVVDNCVLLYVYGKNARIVRYVI